MTEAERIAVGYQAAVDMITAQGADNWARFNALLVSNSVLLAAVGFVLTEKLKVSLPIWLTAGGGCGFGFVLCVLWGLLIWRGDRYVEYWNAVARELESRLEAFNLFRRGQLFGEGTMVSVLGIDLQMRWLTSFRSVVWMYAIIWLFAGLYVVVFLVVLYSGAREASVIEGYSLLISVQRAA